jgi:hypothetical protein
MSRRKSDGPVKEPEIAGEVVVGPDGARRHCVRLRLTEAIHVPGVGHILTWYSNPEEDPNKDLLTAHTRIESVVYDGHWFVLTPKTGGKTYISESIVAWWS